MPKPAAPRYRTTNWSEYNAALKRRGSLEVWFDPQMHWLSKPCGRPGRPMRFSDSAIELCLTLKSLFNLPLRQVTGLVASLIKMAGLYWPVPDYTTLCRRQKTLRVELGGRPSSGGLHLLVDSTGIKMTGEGEWKTRKHGGLIPPSVGARFIWGLTRERWISGRSRSQPMPSAMHRRCLGLLAQIPKNERILRVGGDGAYDTRACHAAIAERGADAVIPVRRNGRPWTKDGPGVDARNEALRATKRLGRAIWKKWSGYHRRSLAETKMHCFKLLGNRVAARTLDRQITELKVRAAILNRFSKMGTPITVRIA